MPAVPARVLAARYNDHSTEARLLRFPAGLRNRIYDYVGVYQGIRVVNSSHQCLIDSGKDRLRTFREPPILQVCSQLRTDMIGMFYGGCIFTFHSDHIDPDERNYTLCNWLLRLKPTIGQYIKEMVVDEEIVIFEDEGLADGSVIASLEEGVVKVSVGMWDGVRYSTSDREFAKQKAVKTTIRIADAMRDVLSRGRVTVNPDVDSAFKRHW